MSNINNLGQKALKVFAIIVLTPVALLLILNVLIRLNPALYNSAVRIPPGSNRDRFPSSSTEELTFDQARAIKPFPLSNVTASLTTGGVKVSWTPVGDTLLLYRIYRRTGFGMFKVIATQEGDDNTKLKGIGKYELIDSKVGLGGVYTYAVTVSSDQGAESDKSNAVTVINL